MTLFYLSNPYQPPSPPVPLPIQEPWALLGGISPVAFMEGYWHKNPLLVRGAIPAFGLAKAAGKPLDSPISAKSLFDLASQENNESRLIQSRPWKLRSGPFSPNPFHPLASQTGLYCSKGPMASIQPPKPCFPGFGLFQMRG